MIKKITGLVLLILVLACNSQVKENEGEQVQEEPKMEIDNSKVLYVEFNVKGMTCEGCENAVTKNIEKLEGIAEIDVSHKQEFAKVRYDSTLTNIEALSKAIVDAGYTVEGYQHLNKDI